MDRMCFVVLLYLCCPETTTQEQKVARGEVSGRLFLSLNYMESDPQPVR